MLSRRFVSVKNVFMIAFLASLSFVLSGGIETNALSGGTRQSFLREAKSPAANFFATGVIDEEHNGKCQGIFPYDELQRNLVTPFQYVTGLSELEETDAISYVKLTILGTQKCWEDVESPIPWMTLEAGGR